MGVGIFLLFSITDCIFGFRGLEGRVEIIWRVL